MVEYEYVTYNEKPEYFFFASCVITAAILVIINCWVERISPVRSDLI